MFGRPAWLKPKHAIFGVVAIVLLTVVLAVMQARLSAGSSQVTAEPSQSSASSGNLPTTRITSSSTLRTPQEWAAQVNAACQKMSPALNADLKEMKLINPNELESTTITAHTTST
jgi:hypothetical protein